MTRQPNARGGEGSAAPAPHAAAASPSPRRLAIGTVLLWLALTAVYWPHFHNPFAFDDGHTIETNAAIRDLANVPRFFVDATTTSSLPASQAWRPGLTTLNAIDTWLSGGTPDPFVFHLSIFASFLLLAAAVALLFDAVFEQTRPGHPANPWLALFGAALFCLHTATVETIGYVIARSDSFSTLMVVAAMALVARSPRARRQGWWIVPMAVGFTVKEPALVLPALVAVYLWLYHSHELRGRRLAPLLAGAAVAVALFVVSRLLTSPTWDGGGAERLVYLRTQAWVLVRYVVTFVLPARLSADTDWRLIEDPLDERVLAGCALLLALGVFAWRCARRPARRPIALGIAWFLLALLPTSSVFPLAEVTNDHRVFFPFVGLAMATAWGIGLALARLDASPWAGLARRAAVALAIAALAAHAAGARARIAVWSSPESLWADVVSKSPGNGRGHMNYGLALMRRGDLAGAERAFRQAQALWPAYPYVEINLAVVSAAQGRDEAAERHFRTALAMDRSTPDAYLHYARWLASRGRREEAGELVATALRLSPRHEELLGMRRELSAPRETALPVAAPSTPEEWLDESLRLYHAGELARSADAAREALRLRPGYADAANNLCAALNRMQRWDDAVQACAQALFQDPGHELARNNLVEARRGLAAGGGSPAAPTTGPPPR